MNVILCGFPACGKSTYGQLAAKLLNWEFIETDHILETLHDDRTGLGWSCRQIFNNEGEVSFRDWERQALATLGKNNPCVIAIGGGALILDENKGVLKELGKIVYLKTQSGVLLERLLKRGIPAVLDSDDPERSLELLIKRRYQAYENSADYIIDTKCLSQQDVTEKIARVGLDLWEVTRSGLYSK